MELVQSYESDSECSNGCTDIQKIPDTDSDNQCEIATKVVPLLKVEKGFAIKEFELPTNEDDYFGFKDITKTKQIEEIKGVQDKTKKINTNYGGIEIPNSEFWRDFIPDTREESVLSETSHSEYYKKQMSHVVTTTNDYLANSGSEYVSFKNSFKRLHQNEAPDYTWPSHSEGKKPCVRNSGASFSSHQPAKQPVFSKPNVKDISCSFGSQTATDGSGNDNKEDIRFKRKLYYIHSKVAPYLHMKPVNKCASKLCSTWSAHNGVINRLAWNVPNYSHLLATAGMDATVKIFNVWSSVDNNVTTLTSHKKAVKHVEWCPGGMKLLSCGYDRTAQVTDIDTAKVVTHCDHADFVTTARIHPANPNLFVTGTDNMMLMWDMRTSQAPVKHFSYKDHFGLVQDVLFISEGRELVSCSDLVTRDSADRSIMTWDTRSGVVLSNQIYQERFSCVRLKLDPDNAHFLAQSQAGYVAIFSTSKPYKMDKSKRFDGHKMQGYSIGFDISPDGSLVYSGSAEGGVHCYTQYGGKLIRKLTSRDVITDVMCHPVLASCLASCTWGGSVSLWV